MPKPERPLQKHTFKLYVGQIEELKRFHPNLPYARILRQLLDAYIAKRKAMEPPVQLDIDVSDLDINGEDEADE